MKFSEAMRLGAMNKPQGYGLTFGDKTCALGAALEAVGKVSADGYWGDVFSIWPIARHHVLYPGAATPGKQMMVGSACWILNDSDKWTREQIADWVASIEDAQEPKTAESTPVPVTVPA